MSSKKKTILFFTLLFFTAVATIAIQALFKYGSPAKNAPSSKQGQSDGHTPSATGEIGGIVDLTNQSEVTMDIKDFKYGKPNIKITKGTKVTWTNLDETQHNVMASHADDSDAHDAPSQDEIKPDVLAGPLLSKGESYSFTFNKVTGSPYHCSPHPDMKGSVTVVE